MAMKKKGLAGIVAGVLVGCFTFGVAGSAIKTKKAQAVTATNDTVVSTYVSENVKIKNAPTVVCEVSNQAILEDLQSAIINDDVKPANAIVTLDESGDVVDSTGQVLGDFETVFSQAFAGRIIPNVRVETESAADALIDFLKNKIDILDIAVVSSNPALVKKVREAKPTVRGVISFIDEVELSEIIKSSNANLANTVILPASKATVENVRYLQSRMKSVWVKAKNVEQMHLNDCVQSGAYGIITEDYQAIYATYERYEESLCRTPFNILNQGVKKMHNENSKIGTQKAIEYGANAVRLDARLTRDNKIVLMYDDSIDRTTNGTGKVNELTLAELRQFKLDLLEREEEPIPILDEVIPIFQETKTVMWLELKENSPSLATALLEVLETYNFFADIVVQASDEMIGIVKEVIPEISTVITRKISAESYPQLAKDIATYNSGVLHDMVNGNAATITAQSFLKDRGFCAIFQGLPHSLNDDKAINSRTQEGVLGFVGNEGAYYRKREMIVYGKTETRPALEINDKIALTVKNYDGTVVDATGNVFAMEDRDDYWIVIAVYKGKLEIPLYTQSFKVLKGEATSTPDNNISNDNELSPPPQEPVPNDGGWIGALSIGALVILGLVSCTFFAVRKAKKRRKNDK